MFRVHPHIACQGLTPFRGRAMFQVWIDTCVCVCPLFVDGHWVVPAFGCCEPRCTRGWTLVWTCIFISLGERPGSGLAGSHGDSRGNPFGKPPDRVPHGCTRAPILATADHRLPLALVVQEAVKWCPLWLRRAPPWASFYVRSVSLHTRRQALQSHLAHPILWPEASVAASFTETKTSTPHMGSTRLVEELRGGRARGWGPAGPAPSLSLGFLTCRQTRRGHRRGCFWGPRTPRWEPPRTMLNAGWK